MATPIETFTSTGVGASPYLSGELFQLLSKTKLTHIPYKGSGPAQLDLMADRVSIMFDNGALGQVKGGKLRALAVQGATALFTKLVDGAKSDEWTELPSLRFTAAGGAPIDLTVKRAAERLFRTTLHNGYGLTEAASISWTRTGDDHEDESVGRPFPGVELCICDAAGNGLPPGTVGELHVRGPNVTVGYFRNPEATADALSADGWFNTRDLARIGTDGRVFVVGRTKDVIIRSGFNVYPPLEVETVLNRHPAISHSAVVGRAVEGNEEIVAFLELRSPLNEAPADLRDHLRASLSAYKHPTTIVVVPALPLAPNGKILKHQLQHMAGDP